MGCCGGSTISDREIKYAVNYKELISIMKNKRNNLGKEKNQIEEYLKDKTKEITLIRVTALDDEQLRKRLPYLDKLSQVYSEVIKLMEDCFVVNIKNIYFFIASFQGNKRTFIQYRFSSYGLL